MATKGTFPDKSGAVLGVAFFYGESELSCEWRSVGELPSGIAAAVAGKLVGAGQKACELDSGKNDT